jgi:hypothetical protein
MERGAGRRRRRQAGGGGGLVAAAAGPSIPLACGRSPPPVAASLALGCPARRARCGPRQSCRLGTGQSPATMRGRGLPACAPPLQVLLQAHEATERFRQGRPLSLLDGVPFAVKDLVDALPYPTAGGTAFLGGRCAGAGRGGLGGAAAGGGRGRVCALGAVPARRGAGSGQRWALSRPAGRQGGALAALTAGAVGATGPRLCSWAG